MNKFSFIGFLLIAVLIFFLAPMATSSLLDLESKIENDVIGQRTRAEQETQRKLWGAKEKVYLTGKFNPAEKENFVTIPAKYNANNYPMYLRKETLSAFLQMREAAEKNKIDLKIVSATRNFDAQKYIWESKWNGTVLSNNRNVFKEFPDEAERFQEILKYGALPGTSRHHWGTDIDINSTDPNYFKTEKGKAEYEWLVKNAPLFGFCQPYTLKGQARSTGYYEEKWHWSYGPISKNLTEEYSELIKEEDIKGFLGDQYTTGQNIINNYVLGINSECLK